MIYFLERQIYVHIVLTGNISERLSMLEKLMLVEGNGAGEITSLGCWCV